MKKTPPILPTYYKSLGTKIFRDTTALPFADGGPLNDRNIKGDLLPSVYASALGNYYSNGGKFFTTGNEYHRVYKNAEGNIMVNHPKEDKGKWDTINLTEKSGANTISEGVDATKQWHAENPNTYANGGMIKRADGSYSKRGLWDNIRANAGSGKEPTKEMLAQERKINNSYADGGELGPGDPPNWRRPNLSPERIAALKALHGDNIFGNVNPNDLLLYDLNKDLVDNATEFKSFLDPTAEIGDRYDNEALTTDLKNRMVKQGYGLDTKTGNYFRIPDEVLKAIQEPEDDFIPIKPPGRIDIPKRDIIRFDNSTTPAPEYDAPGYYRDYPAITWQHHNANQLIPHARPHLTEVRVPGLGAAVIQKITGYNKPAIEGYEDEEGNWIPGEIEKAQEEGRRINFQGANSLEDRRAQKEYNALYDAYEKERQLKGMYPTYIPTKEHAQGGQLKPDYSLPEDSFQQGGRGLKNSVYASSMGQYPANYAEGGAMNQNPLEGPIYTYKGRPGSYYQKDNKGNWYINNKGTSGQYVLVDDPSGQRTAILNKKAIKVEGQQIANTYAEGGMMNAGPGDKILEYNGVQYKQDKSGNWVYAYNNQPVTDKAIIYKLPYEGKPVGSPVVQSAPKPNTPIAIKKEQVKNLKNSPVIADQKTYKSVTNEAAQVEAEELAKLRQEILGFPQHEQPVDMMDYFWTGAALAPAMLPAAIEGAGVLGTRAMPYLTNALGTSIPGMSAIPGATLGNALGSAFAVTSGKNLLEVPSQIQKGNYADATANVLTGALDIGTAGVVSPLYKGTKSTLSELGKVLSTEDGLLSNAYKYNPFAFKANPNAYYRGIGKAGVEDALTTGVLRPNRTGTGLTNNNTYDAVFFDKGRTELAGGLGRGYIAEVTDVPMKEFSPNHMGVAAFDKQTGNFLSQIPLGNNTKLLKKDWLKGYKEIPINTVSKAQENLKTGESILSTAPKKVVGTLDEFGDVVETSKAAPKVTVYGESVPITKPKSGVDFTSTEFNPQAPASSLQEWQDAKKYAQQANQRFINSRSEQDFLVSKYKDEYAKEFGVSPEDLDYKDVLLYGKLKEAAQLPVRHTAPLDTRMLGPKSTDIHESFISSENPRFDLNPEQELVIDSYARGYDDLINQRNSFAGGAFYENKVAPILEQSILQNQFKNAQNLIRGSEDFPIQGMASVMRNGKRVDGIKFSELQEGDTFIPGSFISTSITKPNAAIAGGLDIPSTGFTGKKGNLDYIIKAPEGQSYLYPNSTVIQQFPGEMEAILPKNLKLNLDKIVSDTERGYLNSIKDVKRGEIYKGGILNLEHSPSFTKRPNKYFPFIPQLDKIVDLKGNVVPKSSYQQILDYHNATHQPTIPKYYFSILNPYLFGGKLK